MNKTLVGPYAVLMTPFKNNEVDYEAYEKQVVRLLDTDIAGFMVNGSTAEYVALSYEEEEKIAKLVYKLNNGKKKIILGACTANVYDSYKRCLLAKEIDAEGVLVCPLYYFKYSAKEREEFYTKLADKSPVPVVLYNVPFFTQELELDVIYKLAKHPNIIGIKDSSANIKRIMHMINKVGGDEFKVLTGTDDILYSALFAGCLGSMTALATIFPNEICGIYKAFEEKDYETANKLQQGLMECLRVADSYTFPIGYKKLMEDVSGIPFGNKGDVL